MKNPTYEAEMAQIDAMNLGAHIKAARLSKNLTQKQVSEGALGYQDDYAFYARIERGEHPAAKPDTVKKIATFLEVPESKLPFRYRWSGETANELGDDDTGRSTAGVVEDRPRTEHTTTQVPSDGKGSLVRVVASVFAAVALFAIGFVSHPFVVSDDAMPAQGGFRFPESFSIRHVVLPDSSMLPYDDCGRATGMVLEEMRRRNIEVNTSFSSSRQPGSLVYVQCIRDRQLTHAMNLIALGDYNDSFRALPDLFESVVRSKFGKWED